jgi:hypothetical protein
MAKRVQKLLQGPLLLDIATRSRPVDASQGRDIPDLSGTLRKLFRRRFTEAVNDNDVLWAKKQLEQSKFISVRPRVSWEVTDKGIKHLKQLTGVVFETMPSLRLDAFWRAMTENEEERGVAVLRLIAVDNGSIAEILGAPHCQTSCDLFCEAFARAPSNSTIPFLTSIYEDLLELFFEFGSTLSRLAVST